MYMYYIGDSWGNTYTVLTIKVNIIFNMYAVHGQIECYSDTDCSQQVSTSSVGELTEANARGICCQNFEVLTFKIEGEEVCNMCSPSGMPRASVDACLYYVVYSIAWLREL